MVKNNGGATTRSGGTNQKAVFSSRLVSSRGRLVSRIKGMKPRAPRAPRAIVHVDLDCFYVQVERKWKFVFGACDCVDMCLMSYVYSVLNPLFSPPVKARHCETCPARWSSIINGKVVALSHCRTKRKLWALKEACAAMKQKRSVLTLSSFQFRLWLLLCCCCCCCCCCCWLLICFCLWFTAVYICYN